MIYGMYMSALGADAQSMRQVVLANNLANANTTGFKQDVPVFRAHFPHDVTEGAPNVVPDTFNEQTGGISLEGTVTDFSQGHVQQTGGRLDLALIGQGFLQVRDGEQTLLTRNGRMSLGPNQQLVMSDTGLPVLSVEGEPIELPIEASQLDVGDDGQVFGVTPDGLRLGLGQLAVVQPENLNNLVKLGNSLYSTTDPVKPAGEETRIRQGFIEESGSDPMRGMIDLIETSRGFETNMNMVRFQDEMLGRFLQALPRR